MPDLAVSSPGSIQPPPEAVFVSTNGGNGLSCSSQEISTPGTPVALAVGQFGAPPGGVDNLAVMLSGTNEVREVGSRYLREVGSR